MFRSKFLIKMQTIKIKIKYFWKSIFFKKKFNISLNSLKILQNKISIITILKLFLFFLIVYSPYVINKIEGPNFCII